ncbi:hypothetical protein BDY19DRAFT_988600 [Irpex rosettiformis]|uniref:Uncharacterized protein n=1 Tax=Irpex rosettiformis TaxID=378272 RepID=A0ACB8UK75_9APHY|nr:hypothetical protein BDY19DRAFT_988600 [Irpex rosettiformis]
MSTDPAPSVTRGDVTLQPAYFTSSLFVHPLREDIANLIQDYAQSYFVHIENEAGSSFEHPGVTDSDTGVGIDGGAWARNSANTTVAGDTDTAIPGIRSNNAPCQIAAGVIHLNPFTLFKQLWSSLGWCWLHLKVLDGRARESFINVVLRLFLEYFTEQVNPLAQVVALFGMYTFFSTQPRSSTPSEPLPGPFLYHVKYIALSHDMYVRLLSLPEQLTGPQLSPLSPYVSYLLTALLKQDAFHIYPHSTLKTQCTLPREWFVEDTEFAEVDGSDGHQKQNPKKKGRPGKGERSKKRKDALVQLDKWLDRSTYTYPEHPTAGEASTSMYDAPLIGMPGAVPGKRTTHTLISHPPNASLAIYQMHKQGYLNAVAFGDSSIHYTPVPSLHTESTDTTGFQWNPGCLKEKEAMERANEAMLTRLKKIDEMAAEQGLEVGGEGGEMTGLERVEKAVKEMRNGTGSGRRGGILNLVEGAGINPPAAIEGEPTNSAME